MFLRWSDLDQDKALAWLRREAERCSGCGTFPFEDRGRYIAQAYQCPSCEIKEVESESDGAKAIKGAYVRLLPLSEVIYVDEDGEECLPEE